MSGGLIIRPSLDTDIAVIAAIYGHHVRHGIASFEEDPPTVDEIGKRRAALIERGLPYLVAEREGRVVGYCYAGPYRPRACYRFTLEDSIYIDAAETGRGIGRLLLEPLIERCGELGYRQMIAVIGGGSETRPSVRLHETLGFTHVGILAGIGFKFGHWIDTVLMQRTLGPGSGTFPTEIG
jgi:phosphinothricin acetyltransferase